MTYLDEEKPSPEEILHFGVKGMRWGVRNSSSSSSKKKQGAKGKKRIDNATRNMLLTRSKHKRAGLRSIVSKRASKVDKVIAVTGEIPYYDLVRAKGSLRKAAKRGVAREDLIISRLESGHDTVRDSLKAYGKMSPTDYVWYGINNRK